MSLPLPPDPYKALGVAKDAAVSEVKSAYRKLVLKCHPDKVQDPTLKAQKQDEFQKVQQAYELLTDDAKRTDYDEKMRMFAFRDTLRSQVPKSSPQSARSSPAAHNPPVFDYEVRTAEPRSSRFKTSRAPSPVRVYATGRPASYDDDLSTRMYDMGSSRSARKAASYEDRKVSSREEEKHRRVGEDRERERREKDINKKNLSASKKSRDKERRKGVEEKTSSRHAPFIVDEDDSEDGFPSRRYERRSSKKSDDKIRVTMENGGETNEFVVSERTRKLHLTKDSAAQYIMNAKSKAKGKSLEDEFRPPTVRRSETYHAPPYASRYPAESRQTYIDADSDDEPRRSSARPRSRRPSDDLPPRVPPGNEPYIITADPSSRKPSLQSHSSAPPMVAEPRRKEPQRAQTIQSDYPRRSSASVVPPPLPRASTFNEKLSRSSRLKTEYTYPPSSSSSDSDSDGHVRYASPSRSSRPSPPVQTGTQKRYVVEKSRAVPVTRSHRKVFRDEPARDRSESPRGTPARVPDRPPVTRSSTSSARASSTTRGSSSRTPSYYTSPTGDAPPRSKHDLPRGVQQQSGAGAGGNGPYFGEVKFAPAYSTADVTYGDYYRPGQTTDYYPQSRRGEAAASYA